EDGEPSLSLAKDAFIPMTVLMLQKAIRRIEALEDRVGALEARLFDVFTPQPCPGNTCA
ncbi:MAG: hypothetical protein HQL92_05815, partial [Magnetococcales bacterium]|nr:hypothetical protein [Magnetococcales bacterium]